MGPDPYLYLLIITIGVSLWGFRSASFFDRYSFSISGVARMQWWRFVTSAFLHVGTWHLLVNGLTLYFFAPTVTPYFKGLLFIGLYLISLLIGNLTTFLLYAKQPHYTAVGASGAVSGIVFSSLLVNPGIELYILSKVEPVCNMIEIVFQFWLRRIATFPLPLLLQLFRETVGVFKTFNI